MSRVIWMVIDSVGVGALKDSEKFGDIGVNTLGNIVKNHPDIKIPNMIQLGLGNIDGIDYLQKAENPIGSFKGNNLIKQFLDAYNDKYFLKEDGTLDTLTNVAIVSEILRKLGIKLDGSYQEIEGLAAIYPQEYFSPYDYINCYSKATENTYAIHHYYKSWLPMNVRFKTSIKKFGAKIIGGKNIAKIRSLMIR